MEKKAFLGLLLFVCEELGYSNDDIDVLVAEVEVNFDEYSEKEMLSKFELYQTK